MTLETDVATYLGSTGGANIGLVLASTSAGTSPVAGSVYACPFPEGAPDHAVCIIPYGGLPPVHGMGDSLTAPLAEVQRFQVVVRHSRENYATCRSVAESVLTKLDHFVGTLTSTRYLYIRALAPVIYLDDFGKGGQDGNARHRHVVNLEATKERG